MTIVSAGIALYVYGESNNRVSTAGFKLIRWDMSQAEVESLFGSANGHLPEPNWWKWLRFVTHQPEPKDWGIADGGAWGWLIYDGPAQFAPRLRTEQWRGISARVFIYFDDQNRVKAAVCHAPLNSH